jgi:hypothetical protein
MALDWQNCNYVISLYETDKPVRYEHHKTLSAMQDRIETFKRSQRYYRIWWGKCETMDDEDCEELGDWFVESKPQKRGRRKSKT